MGHLEHLGTLSKRFFPRWSREAWGHVHINSWDWCEQDHHRWLEEVPSQLLVITSRNFKNESVMLRSISLVLALVHLVFRPPSVATPMASRPQTGQESRRTDGSPAKCCRSGGSGVAIVRDGDGLNVGKTSGFIQKNFGISWVMVGRVWNDYKLHLEHEQLDCGV